MCYVLVALVTVLLPGGMERYRWAVRVVLLSQASR
jgi:hypothetical protein